MSRRRDRGSIPKPRKAHIEVAPEELALAHALALVYDAFRNIFIKESKGTLSLRYLSSQLQVPSRIITLMARSLEYYGWVTVYQLKDTTESFVSLRYTKDEVPAYTGRFPIATVPEMEERAKAAHGYIQKRTLAQGERLLHPVISEVSKALRPITEFDLRSRDVTGYEVKPQDRPFPQVPLWRGHWTPTAGHQTRASKRLRRQPPI